MPEDSARDESRSPQNLEATAAALATFVAVFVYAMTSWRLAVFVLLIAILVVLTAISMRLSRPEHS